VFELERMGSGLTILKAKNIQYKQFVPKLSSDEPESSDEVLPYF
jgi:hypothetical protein